ncbi:hypothetical protein KAFR_0B05100 [Kazachstania africana CBS 2517]|uniref:Protein SIP5 n=1 Tax=Kazachstania africana (strain ATCC 22294 / BCRC 22015 / CBS 2517 / CECT 1963 / NBRC 1671 / NRRL Y-8276) TaxID=1071382 RepID=H2AR06_KAZAF|nr:hypothetical protein KAFR_0B05100 [Kazachstania africana CBS 2517]CCF56806.1 hypothetical protein KAFR_0B05100 [Kazachstania africana CBS 2517]
MGNVPAKAEQDEEYANQTRSRRRTISNANSFASSGTARTRSKRTTSLVDSVLNNTNSARSRGNSTSENPYRRRSPKEREAFKEKRAQDLVVRFNETVDGGYLSPFGCYTLDKLDYDIDIVKTLIIERKLAPFYIPLQDFNQTWSDDEIVKIVDGLPLHSSNNVEIPDELEDLSIGDLSNPNFDYLIDKKLSKKDQSRQRSKIFKARLYQKRIIWQETENEVFLEKKLEEQLNKYLPNDALKLNLYKNGTECPICFLYFPKPMNYSKCCQQPICTECFVQIKRSAPHFPHDENVEDVDDVDKDPNLLISEPSNCPYCATPDFAVIYNQPNDRKVGINGILPSQYTLDNKVSTDTVTEPFVITSDFIRPDWKIKLNKDRLKLQRRSANATAIHLSNQLVDPSHNSATNTRTELEDRLVEEAIKLSLEEDNAKSENK